jgi:hypothetical protein
MTFTRVLEQRDPAHPQLCEDPGDVVSERAVRFEPEISLGCDTVTDAYLLKTR